jgi:hypothetical protein
MRMALAGDYHPRSYSDLEIELATVIYELGGGAALHALHNSPFAFPSRKTIFEHRREFRLRITVGAVKMTDILANIETMFVNVKPDHRTVGITLSMDEVASDARLCYLTTTDEIAGLCEHATADLLLSVKMGTDLTVVRAVRQAVREGKIHIGQEVFVAAFSRNDEEGYGARPVLLIPTCKRGSFKDSALIIEMLRQAWRISPCGEALHAAAVWLQSMHTTRGDHILSRTSTTHMVNLLADLATQCQFSIPTSHLRPSPCQFSNSSGLQYSVTTMMSSLDSVVISVYFFACITYIVKSHS